MQAETRWGLTIPLLGPDLRGHEQLVRRAEAVGYTDIWSGETQGPDGFTPLALAAAWTDTARLGTGVVGVFTRGPALLAQQAAALAEASNGRFALGIGSSSDVIVERWNGIPFEKPLTKVSETVDELREVLGGGRGRGGFRLEKAPEQPVPIIVAALRGGMLRMAAEKADGAFTNFLPLSALPKITAEIESAPAGFELLCRFFCIPGERDEVSQSARWLFASYATVPVYENFFRWLGHGEAIDPMVDAWRAGDRDAALAAVPMDLVSEIALFGSPDEIRDQVLEFMAGGITLPILTPFAAPDQLGDVIEALAPADNARAAAATPDPGASGQSLSPDG